MTLIVFPVNLMNEKKFLDGVFGTWTVRLDVFEGDPGQHDYGISRQCWIRGMKFMNRYGAERALDLVDQRAERAAGRGDYESARRWRSLITAIHAVQEDEQLPGQNMH